MAAPAGGPTGDGPAQDTIAVPVWDVWVRLFHWSLVTAVLFQIVSGTSGWQFFDWHRPVGELVLALVAFRLLWGLFGSSNARLAALLRSPAAAFAHLRALARREVDPERRHNAAGSWAVLAMLALLGVQAGTGLFIADEDEFIEGAWYGALGSDTTALLYRVHHANATLLETLIVVHVLMIAVYFVWARRDLLTPMLLGHARWPAAKALPPLRLQRWWVGALLAALSLVVTGAVTGWFG